MNKKLNSDCDKIIRQMKNLCPLSPFFMATYLDVKPVVKQLKKERDYEALREVYWFIIAAAFMNDVKETLGLVKK